MNGARAADTSPHRDTAFCVGSGPDGNKEIEGLSSVRASALTDLGQSQGRVWEAARA